MFTFGFESIDHQSIAAWVVAHRLGALLAKNPINGNRMRDVVNFIRYRPGTFRLWHSSATAKLFSPPKFENKKDSHGYFF